MPYSYLTATLLYAPLLAITVQEARAQEPIARDSAGITIVDHAGSNNSPSVLRVSDRPTLRIGVRTGDSNYEFSRIVAATRLQDGTIVVADRESAEIRFFDSAGRFVRKVGREGLGPGEFRELTHLYVLTGDSIAAWDAIGSRFTVFTPQGDVARTFSPRGGPASRTVTVVRGLLADGGFFGYRTTREPPPAREAITRDTLTMAVYTRDGRYIRDLGSFLGHESRKRASGRGIGPSGVLADIWSVKGVPFARETFFETSRGTLYVGDSRTYEIFAYEGTGILKRIIRVHQQPRPVTRRMIEQFRRERNRFHRPRGPRVDPNIDAAIFPKVLPAYAAFQIDAAQRLWVADYPAPGDKEGQWSVFEADGTLVGRVVTPGDVEVLHIGTAHLVGIWRDEFDVEYIHVYTLSLPR